jgi:hypothetical protein
VKNIVFFLFFAFLSSFSYSFPSEDSLPEVLSDSLPTSAIFDLRIGPLSETKFRGEVEALFDSIHWIRPKEIKKVLLFIEPYFWSALLKKEPAPKTLLLLDEPFGFAGGKGSWKTINPNKDNFLLFRFGKWILWLEGNGNNGKRQQTTLIATEIKDTGDPSPIYFHYFQGQYPKIKSIVPFRYIDPEENKSVDCIGISSEDQDKGTIIEAFELESQERILRLEENELTESSPDWEWLLTSDFDFMPIRLLDPKDPSSPDTPLAVTIRPEKANNLLNSSLSSLLPKKGEVIFFDRKENSTKIKDTEGASFPRLSSDGTVGWIQKNHLVLYRYGRVFQYFPFEGNFSLNWCFSNHGKEICLYSRKPSKRIYRLLLASNLFLYWLPELELNTQLPFSFEEIFSKYDVHSGMLLERIVSRIDSPTDSIKLPSWVKALKALNQFYFE